MKTAIVTGAYGFAGAKLVEHLLQNEYKVYAVGRRSSSHNDRFLGAPADRLVPVFLEMEEYGKLSEEITEKADSFFHLAWGGGRDDYDAQKKNVEGAVAALEAAARINPDIRFVGIGSQAEYGIKSDAELITEDMSLEPINAYGDCKKEAYHILKSKSEELGIDFIWGRIFSLIGKYEPQGRMFPDLVHKLSRGEKISLSSCEQYWDYLDAVDCAEAITALGEKGKSGENYNIANGGFKPLRDYVLEAANILGADPSLITFGKKAEPFISLRPSVSKIQADTGWKAHRTVSDSIKAYNFT